MWRYFLNSITTTTTSIASRYKNLSNASSGSGSGTYTKCHFSFYSKLEKIANQKITTPVGNIIVNPTTIGYKYVKKLAMNKTGFDDQLIISMCW